MKFLSNLNLLDTLLVSQITYYCILTELKDAIIAKCTQLLVSILLYCYTDF